MVYTWELDDGLAVGQGASPSEAQANVLRELDRLHRAGKINTDVGSTWYTWVEQTPGRPLPAVTSISRPAALFRAA